MIKCEIKEGAVFGKLTVIEFLGYDRWRKN